MALPGRFRRCDVHAFFKRGNNRVRRGGVDVQDLIVNSGEACRVRQGECQIVAPEWQIVIVPIFSRAIDNDWIFHQVTRDVNPEIIAICIE